MAHMANAALAAEECGMRVDQEVLDATMDRVGLASGDIEVEPFRSAFERAANEAQIRVEALGSEAVCERLDLMYGPTGFRVPGSCQIEASLMAEGWRVVCVRCEGMSTTSAVVLMCRS